MEIATLLLPLRKLTTHLETIRELHLLVRPSYWLQMGYSEISIEKVHPLEEKGKRTLPCQGRDPQPG